MNKIKKNFVDFSILNIDEICKKLNNIVALKHDKEVEIESENWRWQCKRLLELAKQVKTDANFVITPFEIAMLSLLTATEVDEISELQKRVVIIANVLGVVNEFVALYALDIVIEILEGKKSEYDMAIFLRSIGELAKDKDAKQLAEKIGDHFSANTVRHAGEQDWETFVQFAVFAHVAYSRFEILDDKTQARLLGSCYFKALVVGVQIRVSLEKALYDTRNTFSYINLTKFFSDVIIGNTEEIVLAGNKKTTFGLLAQDCLKTVGDGWPNDLEQKKYITAISMGLSSASIGCIERALDIFRHLQHADLIDHNRGGELSKSDQYRNDTIQLLSWFGIGADGSEPLIQYFKQPNRIVSVLSFIRRLQETAKLADRITIDNILELTQFLHKEKLLAADLDLIEFHESDNQFHWNEKLLE